MTHTEVNKHDSLCKMCIQQLIQKTHIINKKKLYLYVMSADHYYLYTQRYWLLGMSASQTSQRM